MNADTDYPHSYFESFTHGKDNPKSTLLVRSKLPLDDPGYTAHLTAHGMLWGLPFKRQRDVYRCVTAGCSFRVAVVNIGWAHVVTESVGHDCSRAAFLEEDMISSQAEIDTLRSLTSGRGDWWKNERMS
jgi:hypothetical protein